MNLTDFLLFFDSTADFNNDLAIFNFLFLCNKLGLFYSIKRNGWYSHTSHSNLIETFGSSPKNIMTILHIIKAVNLKSFHLNEMYSI